MTIVQAAARSGVPPKTIRFYEDTGIIKRPARSQNGYRAYTEPDVHVLRFTHHARRLGFSLKDAAALIELYRNKRRASRDVKTLALQNVARLDRKIVELTAMRNAPAALAERCHGDQRPECPILDDLVAETG